MSKESEISRLQRQASDHRETEILRELLTQANQKLNKLEGENNRLLDEVAWLRQKITYQQVPQNSADCNHFVQEQPGNYTCANCGRQQALHNIRYT